MTAATPKTKKTKAKTPARKKLASAKSYIKKIVSPKSKKKTPARKTITRKSLLDADDLQKKIQDKAYQVFEMRGFMHGSDLFDWYIAERLVRAQNGSGKAKKMKEKDAAVEIQNKANEIFDLRGRTQGFDLFDWLIAEELVRSGE